MLFGDFNSAMNKVLDKSVLTSADSEKPKCFKKWLLEQQMVDVWRNLNESARDYTCY